MELREQGWGPPWERVDEQCSCSVIPVSGWKTLKSRSGLEVLFPRHSWPLGAQHGYIRAQNPEWRRHLASHPHTPFERILEQLFVYNKIEWKTKKTTCHIMCSTNTKSCMQYLKKVLSQFKTAVFKEWFLSNMWIEEKSPFFSQKTSSLTTLKIKTSSKNGIHLKLILGMPLTAFWFWASHLIFLILFSSFV